MIRMALLTAAGFGMWAFFAYTVAHDREVTRTYDTLMEALR
jgi:hypothetical protein